ncbi:tRNA1(Val) (adenine(37)-N6)-methyltransferase [Shouchella sp. JSM 1781072]|uniref:tRNA1(Val) (adenine(37)-N6)-methyltransferase n=1 Tax=Bacillaceae TaxID=186817 RepID=UPI000C08975E|nr:MULTISPECIES: tRNA1(Val) (adenine(37)-N6)-methyltransferase [Bacillaceae]UTR06529.1 tRNA1(Val) (adenine(37)-N6)-methyltransferase [Alkalihalobacillus sp. LMS6]
MLEKDERLDHIAGTSYKIVQSDQVFTYSIDAVLLARFASIPLQKGRILDLCSGNGVVGITMTERTKALISLLELQEPLHSMASRSIKGNGLEKQLTPICADLKHIRDYFAHGFFDAVTCNPPYFTKGDHEQMKLESTKALARHELSCTLDDVIAAGSYVLKHGGKFTMVHRPERMVEIMETMKQHRIEPKRIRFCHSSAKKPSTMLLIEGTKGGKQGLVCEAPLFVYDQDGKYTTAFNKEYFGV